MDIIRRSLFCLPQYVEMLRSVLGHCKWSVNVCYNYLLLFLGFCLQVGKNHSCVNQRHLKPKALPCHQRFISSFLLTSLMAPSYPFPPAFSLVSVSSLLVGDFVAYFNTKLEPSGLNCVVLWCSSLQVYPPQLHFLDLAPVSWRVRGLPLGLGLEASSLWPTLPTHILGLPSAQGHCFINSSLYFKNIFTEVWLISNVVLIPVV